MVFKAICTRLATTGLQRNLTEIDKLSFFNDARTAILLKGLGDCLTTYFQGKNYISKTLLNRQERFAG